MKYKYLDLNSISVAMLGGGGSFKDIYYPELLDCIPELIEFIKKRKPLGLTRVVIERNGYKKWEPCLRDAPNLKSDFGILMLKVWICFFFEYPDLMELIGIIAEQENPKADPEVIKEMRSLKTGALITKSNERGPLTGMRIVFTGASSYFKGEAMEDFLKKNGASTTHTVTTNTELLITGKRPSNSKLVMAKNYGIKIITEEDFIKELGDQLVGLPK